MPASMKQIHEERIVIKTERLSLNLYEIYSCLEDFAKKNNIDLTLPDEPNDPIVYLDNKKYLYRVGKWGHPIGVVCFRSLILYRQ